MHPLGPKHRPLAGQSHGGNDVLFADRLRERVSGADLWLYLGIAPLTEGADRIGHLGGEGTQPVAGDHHLCAGFGGKHGFQRLGDHAPLVESCQVRMRCHTRGIAER